MPKGIYERTEGMKKNMSLSAKERFKTDKSPMLGKKHSLESRKNMSLNMKGRISPNLGKKLSEETKQKISEACKGKKHSEETKQKMSKSQQKRKERDGYMVSPEARKKISESMKGVNNPMYNKHHLEETKIKISKSTKGRKMSEETKRKMSEAQKGEKNHQYGKHHSHEVRLKMSLRQRGNKNHNWNPNREEVYAPYGENFYRENLRNNKWNLQYGRDMLTGTKLNPDKRPAYHHIDSNKANDEPENHCFLSINNHCRITMYQKNPIKSERYKKILQENTLALKNGQIPKNWSPLNKELFRQEKLKQLDLSSYII